MTFTCNIKNRKKQLLNMLVFLSGFGFLCLQLWHTFQTFIEQRSTFDVSKQLHRRQKPPTIVFCPNHEWANSVIWSSGKNFSDKEWHDKLNITIQQRKFDASNNYTNTLKIVLVL